MELNKFDKEKELASSTSKIIEEKPAEVVTRPNITCSVVLTYLKSAVVEPYLMLFMFSFAGRSITNQTLFKEKACRIELAYNSTICDDIHSYSDIENEVQILANNYNTGANLLGILPAIVTNVFLSSWSDNYGRKIPLLIATSGIILEYVGIIINVLDFELPMVFLLLPAIPGGVCGGILVIMTATVSFISDDSDPSTRVLRFTLFEFAFILASPIGTAVCGILFEKSGFLAVYLTCLSCMVAGFLLLAFRLKEKRKKKLRRFREAMRSLFSLENVKANIKTCAKKREGSVRLEMWLIFVAMSCTILNMMGTISVEFFFVSKMYNWSNYTFSMTSMVFSFMKGFAVMITVPLFTKLFNVSDITLSLIGIVSTLAQTIQKGLAYKEWLYYCASICGILGGLASIGVRARLSKLVPREEIGRVFSVLTLCESLTPVFGIVAFAQIYNASIEWFPGMAFMVSAVFLVVSMIIFIWIARFGGPPPFENAVKSTGYDNEVAKNNVEKELEISHL